MKSLSDDPIEPIAPWWHTILVLLPLAIGSAVSVRQDTLEHVNLPHVSFRLSAYLTVMVEEWFTVSLIWLGLKRRGSSISNLISGRWSTPLAFVKDLALSIGFLIVALPLSALVSKFLSSLNHAPVPNEINFLPLTWLEAIVWIFLAATAGFAEELIFRGYLLRQFRAWTGSAALAIAIQGLLFGLAHGYYSTSMFVLALYGWLIGALAWWRKSLRPGMLAHGLEDATLGLLAFFLAR